MFTFKKCVVGIFIKCVIALVLIRNYGSNNNRVLEIVCLVDVDESQEISVNDRLIFNKRLS